MAEIELLDIALAKENFRGDLKFFLEMYQIFKEEFVDQHKMLIAAADNEDVAAARRVCHELLSPLGNLAVRGMVELVNEMRESAKVGDFAELRAKIVVLEQYAEQLDSEVSALNTCKDW